MAAQVGLAIEGMEISELAQTRVLLVEDHDVNRILATRILKKWGITPHLATDGRQAIDMARQFIYDLILMDLQLPLVDGYEAARQIRQLPDSGPHRLPILGLSADVDDEILKKALEAGLTDVLAKPFKQADLLEKILRLCP